MGNGVEPVVSTPMAAIFSVVKLLSSAIAFCIAFLMVVSSANM